MTGAELIAQERQRQIQACGWTPEHDDTQTSGELLECAIAIADDVWTDTDSSNGPRIGTWPFQRSRHVIQKYGKDHIRRLTIAGALIAAEIDRLQRCPAQAGTGGE